MDEARSINLQEHDRQIAGMLKSLNAEIERRRAAEEATAVCEAKVKAMAITIADRDRVIASHATTIAFLERELSKRSSIEEARSMIATAIASAADPVTEIGSPHI